MDKTRIKLQINGPFLLVLTLLLAGCAAVNQGPRAMDPATAKSLAGIHQAIPPEKITNEPLQIVAQAVKLVGENRLAEASDAFNRALKLDPANSYIHFLNALTYHLRAAGGDGSFFDLAQQGYELALKFDQTNWLASYQMGLLQLDRKDFAEAQRWFADALQYNNKDADLLYSMVAASYYARDPRTAAAVLSRLQELEPGSQRVLQAATMINAALDKPEAARDFLARFQDTAPDRPMDRIKVRLADWQNFYDRNGKVIKTAAAAADLKADLRPELLLASSDSGDPPPNRASWLAEEETETEPAEPDENQMAIVDVVIIRTEENLTTRKGVNLLNGLTVQFGPTTWTSTSDRTHDRLTVPQTLTNKQSTEQVITGFTIPALSYSLNIFNTNTDRNEILARPTLVGLNGEQSEFFTGTKLKAAAVATSAAGGESVEVEEEIGVKLVITPTFLDDGRIKLAVAAERTFLKTPSSDVTFQFKLEMTQTRVSANVVMNFGETLILSGLSEKETERKRDGVPLLQDLPGIQYLFSRKDTKDFQKSVLILITPRTSQYTYHERGQNNGTAGGQPSGARGAELNELQARYSDWFKPYPNWASVFHHFQTNSLYREFRTGDVTMEHWENQQNLTSRMRDALGFLYY